MLLFLACTAPPSPDVLLITLDTTRADALACYGGANPCTPTLDALATTGMRVAEASSVTPLTLPAHTSIMTGLYPDRHGVRDNNGFQVSSKIDTLAEILTSHGYQTAAFVSAAVLDHRFGLNQGFERYIDGFDNSMADHSAQVPDRQADITRGTVQEWLDVLAPDRPFFGWVHFYDAHQPLVAPQEWIQCAGGNPYLGEVAFVDAQIRILQDHILLLERNRPLLLVVSGDHGEDRGDHGEGTHGMFVYRSTMHIPMIFSGAGVPKDVVYTDPASLVDIVPTILSLIHQPIPEDLDGQVLIIDNKLQPRLSPVYAESWSPRYQFGFSELRSLQDRKNHYIRAPHAEIYDWQTDPNEKSLLPNPSAIQVWSERMDAFLKGRTPIHAVDDVTSSLVSLGYVSPLSDVDVDTPYYQLPDPKDHPSFAVEFSIVTQAARSRPPEQGVPILEEWLKQYPQVGAAKLLLSRGYMLLGRFDEAQSMLTPLLMHRPENVQLLLQQGNIWLESKNYAAARDQGDRLRQSHPEEVGAWGLAAEARRRNGDCYTALRVVADGLRQHPDAGTLVLIQASCLIEQGESAATLPALRRLIVRDPRNADAALVLSMALLSTGDVLGAIPLLERRLQLIPSDTLAHSLLDEAKQATH